MSRNETLQTSGSILRGGDILTIVASPNSGYILDTLTLTGIRDNGDGTYTVIAQNGESTPEIEVSFKMTEVAPSAPAFFPEADSGLLKPGANTITITSDNGAEIYYTTNGDTPTDSSTLYRAPVVLTENTTLKAIAVKNGLFSDVSTGEYYVRKAETPVIYYPSTNVKPGDIISVTAYSGNTVYYTTDGSDPTTGSSSAVVDINGIQIAVANDMISGNGKVTIKAYATQEDSFDSDIATAEYSVTMNTLRASSANTEGTVTITVGETTISSEDVSAAVQAYFGQAVTLSVTPETGYQLAGITYSYSWPDNQQGTTTGLPVPDATAIETSLQSNAPISLHITMPSADILVGATFASTTNAGYSDGEHYTVSSEKIVKTDQSTDTVKQADVYDRVTIIPEQGYYVETLTYVSAGEDQPSTVSGESIVDLPVGSSIVSVTVKKSAHITLIETESDLISLRSSLDSGIDYTGITVTLANDIVLTSEWSPIGTSDNPFTGNFNGNGHTVSNVRLIADSSGDCAGFFGYVCGAEIKDLSLSGTADVDVFYVGGIVASVDGIIAFSGTTTITGCRNAITIENSRSSGYEGGITAYGGIITGCRNDAAISGVGQGTGGIVAFASGSITNCVNYGSVANSRTGSSNAGGIVAYKTDGTAITACVNHGVVSAVSSGSSNAAGIAARASGINITSCYNTGAISAIGGTKNNHVINSAGILARNPDSVQVVIDNCWNSGSITASGTGTGAGAGIGEIAPTLTTSANGRDSYEIIEISEDIIKVTSDNYTSSDAISVAVLNASHSGTWVEKDGVIMLFWEAAQTVSDAEVAVSFDVTPEAASAIAKIAVYSDETRTTEVMPGADGYVLKGGTYYYEVTATGYVPVQGSFTVDGLPITLPVAMGKAATMYFTVNPAGANPTLTIAPVSSVDVAKQAVFVGTNDTTYTYTLYDGIAYTCEVSAVGYNGTMVEFTAKDGDSKTITLTASSQGQTDKIIKPDNVPYTISEGGSYDLAAGDFASGYVYIDTTEPVTIIGSGVANSSMSEELHIVGRVSGIDLTLQDVYISNTDGKANMIDFQGTGNTLNFSGTSILDQNSNASGYAMIHVPDSAELTVTGGTLYMYKREQGAGIGGNGGASGGEGQTSETNGAINIIGATIFAKNSKQGALIGAGAQAGTQTPGPITIENSTLYLIPISRGAAIGGSAGSGGASSGSYVTVRNSQITVNVDYTGAAIGGGGYDAGNDSDGGTLVTSGSSIRTFIDTNAVPYWEGVTGSGVNGNKAITASVQTNGQSAYLLVFNTEGISGSTFTVTEGGTTVYSGPLHQYRYVNEDTEKYGQTSINYTMDNWTSLDDTNLYLYLTGEDHTLTVNGKTYNVTWDAATESFTVKDSSGSTVNPGSDGGTAGTGGTTKETISETTIDEETGVATVTTDTDALIEAAETTDENTEIVLSVEIPEDAEVSTVTTVVDGNALAAIAESGATLKAESPIGDITLSGAALEDIAAENGETVTLTVSENTDGSVSIEIAVDGEPLTEIDGGVKVKLPETEDGQVLVIVHADGTEEIVKKSLVEDGTAYALLDGSVTVKVVDNAIDFVDVADNAWYAPYVDFASSHELFFGVSDTEFAPSAPMTRAMMVTVLYRLESAIANGETPEFQDVPADRWYSDAVVWGSETGIVEGYGNGVFGTNDEVTREQMATFLYRYVKYLGLDVSASGSLNGFTDGDETSGWAKEAMQWAVGAGLFVGNDKNELNPKDTATRAEVATLFQRLVSFIVK